MIAGSAGTRAAASKRRQDAAQKKKLSKEDEQFIQAVYVKYDINKDGELAKDELMKLLTDLNDGTEPTDEEVDELISQADKNSDGTVNKKEFMNVIRAWYLMENEKGKSSGCCVVM